MSRVIEVSSTDSITSHSYTYTGVPCQVHTYAVKDWEPYDVHQQYTSSTLVI